MQFVGVVGAGTMGHGIAQVAASVGFDVALFDSFAGAAERGLGKIRGNLDVGVQKAKITAAERDATLARIRAVSTLGDLAPADIVIEAIPEHIELKHTLFTALDAVVRPSCVLATNTSSISISRIAAGTADPGRVIGTHFFNPVHLMALLEIVMGSATRADVLEATRAFGERLGKDVIVVKDAPGFATSRLGVCLGMEAIRMVEQGVASPEDIDKAMVLGYRHPVGPLRLTDMVGLDVRLAIGEYLARELGNPAFEPPALMRTMVAEGRLGKKAGRGFYTWE